MIKFTFVIFDRVMILNNTNLWLSTIREIEFKNVLGDTCSNIDISENL